MKRLLLAIATVLTLVSVALAQQFQGPPVQGAVVNRSTKITTVVIAAGNTFQIALASIIGDTTTQRQALTIQNNNTTTDNCWLFLGPNASATKAKSILLAPGQAYTRYWPFVPSDEVNVTCATTSNTMYVDNQ